MTTGDRPELEPDRHLKHPGERAEEHREDCREQDPGCRQRVVIVGAGQTGRALARHLAGERRVAILDTEPAKLDRIQTDGAGIEIEKHARDGTSALALREAGAAGAEWVVATTDRDSVNIEVCRVARELTPRPGTIGTLRESNRIKALRGVGADTIVRPAVIATQIRNRIERSHQIATSIGIGKGEIREIQVLPSSPVVGLPLRELNPRNWLVAAIYRDDRFVAPHGESVIEAGDRLLITGEPEVAPGVAEFLREGRSLFPLEFGSHIVVLADRNLPDVAWREAEYLFRTSLARRFRVVAEDGAAPPDDFGIPTSEVARVPSGDDPVVAARPDAGCVVVGRGRPSFAARVGFEPPPFLATMARLRCPVLLPGGTFPWERILIPVTDADTTVRAGETAFGLERQFRIPIEVIAVQPPPFLGRISPDPESNDRALEALDRLAGLHRTRLEVRRLEGNPAKRLAASTRPGDLVVMGFHPERTGTFFRPESSVHMLIRVRATVLSVPIRPTS